MSGTVEPCRPRWFAHVDRLAARQAMAVKAFVAERTRAVALNNKKI